MCVWRWEQKGERKLWNSLKWDYENGGLLLGIFAYVHFLRVIIDPFHCYLSSNDDHFEHVLIIKRERTEKSKIGTHEKSQEIAKKKSMERAHSKGKKERNTERGGGDKLNI